MALVAYSDSEGSDDDTRQTSQPAKTSDSKPAFQPLVDRSNPRKLKVKLPEVKPETPANGDGEDGPARKKARTGGGTFSGFNSLLPAPKWNPPRPGGEGKVDGQIKKEPPRKVFSLKTGAEPGFDRGADAEMRLRSEEQDAPEVEVASQSTNGKLGKDFEMKSDGCQSIEHSLPLRDEPQKKGNPMMFNPLSVARNSKKKKPIAVTQVNAAAPINSNASSQAAMPPPKVSLFSLGGDQKSTSTNASSKTDYEPLVYEGRESKVEKYQPEADDDELFQDEAIVEKTNTTKAGSDNQSLDTIANELNLSAAAKRQLFGRSGKGGSASKIVNFNTDEEYAANEAFRAAGEQVQHSPVKAIAPGKHSLKQLVNAASHQKDALEEHFASGKRNKKEAGYKYGW